MPEQKRPHLPIGYWLRKADELITARVDHAQQANGLSRTDWQVLNVLHELASATREQLAEPLRPFVDTVRLEAIIHELAGRGLVEGAGTADDGFRLTGQGRCLHATALTAQKEVRQQAVRGVSEADYATTIRVLQRMVENLSDDDAAWPGASSDGSSVAPP